MVTKLRSLGCSFYLCLPTFLLLLPGMHIAAAQKIAFWFWITENEEVKLEDGRLTVTYTTTYDAVTDSPRSPPPNITKNEAGLSAGNGGAGRGAALLKMLPKLQ